MTVVLWSSAWLLQDFNDLLGRVASEGADPSSRLSVEAKYQRLSKAQARVVTDVAGICPSVFYPKVGYPTMPTMSTTDHQVFTFGTDANGEAIAPIGQTQLYRSLNDIPDFPMVAGCDYLDEGTQIRIPGNRTYTGTIYWRGIAPPPDITPTVGSVLFPPAHRQLISLRAAITFQLEGQRNPTHAAQLTADYQPLWLRCLQAWRTQFADGGGLGNWTGLQLALAGAPNGIGLVGAM